MSENSTRLKLPFIQPAQAQKHVTHNEAIELLDVIVNLRLEVIGETVPPNSPDEGACWFIGDNPTGDWDNHQGEIAAFLNGGWLYVTPKEGWSAWDVENEKLRVFKSTDWEFVLPNRLDNFEGFGVNAISDATNRLSVSAPASLFSNEGSDHRLTINKASETDTTSIVFQSDFVGKAELGLIGNNNLALRVSDDGTNWSTALTVSESENRATIADCLRLAPSATPINPMAGDIYFDGSQSKLRCYDGIIWNDLF